MSRTIGHADRFLVASLDYVATMPQASHPNVLEVWDWVRFLVRPD